MIFQTHPKLIPLPAPVVLPVILLVILTCGGVCAANQPSRAAV